MIIHKYSFKKIKPKVCKLNYKIGQFTMFCLYNKTKTRYCYKAPCSLVNLHNVDDHLNLIPFVLLSKL